MYKFLAYGGQPPKWRSVQQGYEWPPGEWIDVGGGPRVNAWGLHLLDGARGVLLFSAGYNPGKGTLWEAERDPDATAHLDDPQRIGRIAVTRARVTRPAPLWQNPHALRLLAADVAELAGAPVELVERARQVARGLADPLELPGLLAGAIGPDPAPAPRACLRPAGAAEDAGRLAAAVGRPDLVLIGTVRAALASVSDPPQRPDWQRVTAQYFDYAHRAPIAVHQVDGTELGGLIVDRLAAYLAAEAWPPARAVERIAS